MLTVSGLTIAYEFPESSLTALSRVDIEIKEREFLAVVGESGCGKSTLALSLIGLLPSPPARIVGGSIVYRSTNIVKLSKKELRRLRGTEIAMIFQEPLTSLNPVYRVGDQIAEAIIVRNSREDGVEATRSDVMQKVYRTDRAVMSRGPWLRRRLSPEGRREIVDWLKLVRIPDPEQVLDRYPFELSGGMRQRVMIAMALSQRPKLLIADEPTTALDVTTQAQVLKLMKELITEVDTTVLLITHDLAVASQVADRVLVMYAGEVVEDAGVYGLFADSLHPYTVGLLSCIPTGSKRTTKLLAIPGTIPDLSHPPKGCRYASRCPMAMDVCLERAPRMIEAEEGHRVSCFLHDR